MSILLLNHMTVKHFSLIRDSDCNRKLKNVSFIALSFFFSCIIFSVSVLIIYTKPLYLSLSGAEHSVLAGEGCQRLCLLQRPDSQPEGVWRAACTNEGGEWTKWEGQNRQGERETDRKTDSRMEEVRGMDTLVSCLCWGAGETHQAGDKHIFCCCYTTATPISGWDRGDKQDMR